ncbi:ankyrin repeat domain-containing 34A-like [Brachionus plicatilis]|uniref:Ankyrin repeat domain-containing 34A-like n=1 Tax=Brachionus plicatilis TaxID=10195 RepID=A0A3M7SSP7_BRAPC|nr:ankyrin repeat domain-containing 34A-like [Brachionus plicatilis]
MFHEKKKFPCVQRNFKLKKQPKEILYQLFSSHLTMITQLNKHLNDHFNTMDLRPGTTPNRSKSTGDQAQQTLRRSDLLLNLAFNLSKGHFNFVSELLKSKLGKQSTIDVNVDETVKYEHLKFETNNVSKKFLLGKNPLILCNYLRENDWALSISQLLVQNGANISQRDHCNGCSSLHYACALLKAEIIEFLLRNINQNPNYLIDNNGNSPIFYLVASYGSLDHEKLILLEEKILSVLKIYFNYLKHYNLKINIRNRNGLSFYGLWEFFTINNKFLLENSVFKYTLKTILEENPALRKLGRFKSLIDLKPETDYYTLSITPNNLPIHFCLIRDESGPDRYVEIYRKNIHIPLSHDQHYFKSSNEKKNFIQNDLNWRHKFNQLFNSLEIKNSESYRASAKCAIEAPKIEQSIRISPHHSCHLHQHANQSNQSQHAHEASHINHKTDVILMTFVISLKKELFQSNLAIS